LAQPAYTSYGMGEGVDLKALRGLTVLWIDDNAGDDLMLDQLKQRSVRVTIAANRDQAVRELRRQRPDVVLSDITRYGNSQAGFDDLEYLHNEGIYDGPTIFYAGSVTQSRQTRADQLGAVAITADPAEVLRTLAQLASGMILPGWRSG
jgi:CheY-like chemotaxis protein